METTVKILIVDDIEANLISLEYLFGEYFEEVEVLKAQSAQEALQTVLAQPVDCIILDIQMPEMDGFEVAKLLKSNKKTKDIPIVFLTAAFKEEEFQERGFALGAVDYLTKPIDNRQFINKIRLYIEIFKKNRQLQNTNTVLQQALKENLKQRHLLRTILDTQTNLVLVNDFEELFMGNKALLDFFGLSSEEEFHSRYRCLIESFIGDENTIDLASLQELESPKERFERLYEIVRESDESARIVMLRGRKRGGVKVFYIDIAKQDDFYLLSLTDITKMQRLHHETAQKAFYDNLTGVFNRNKFNELAHDLIDEALEISLELSCLMFDIDHFKSVNDTYGHLVGDEVLKSVAAIIQKNVRKTDLLCRWGGEEFIMVLPGSDAEKARQIAEKIRESIATTHFDEIGNVTISIGVTQLQKDDSVESLIERCDKALYKAKENGRNRVEKM